MIRHFHFNHRIGIIHDGIEQVNVFLDNVRTLVRVLFLDRRLQEGNRVGKGEYTGETEEGAHANHVNSTSQPKLLGKPCRVHYVEL